MTDGVLLTGKRGHGKSLIAAHRAREYMSAGRMVATNLNLRVEHLVSPRNRIRPFRLPDWPSASDLESLPLGNPGLQWRDGEAYPVLLPSYSEDRNGLLILDELATFLNSRTWQENKDARQAVVSWFLHSRKFGWDLLLIAQAPGLVDKQLRDSLFDQFGSTRRLDKVQVPIVGRLAGVMGIKLRMPKWHVATIRYGLQPGAPLCDSIWLRGQDLYRAYDTTQKINPDGGVKSGEGFQYLSHWDLRGRYMGWWEMNRKFVALFLGLGIAIGGGGAKLSDRYVGHSESASRVVEEKFAAGVSAKGYFRDGNEYRVLLSDGRILGVEAFRVVPGGWQAKAGALWYQGDGK